MKFYGGDEIHSALEPLKLIAELKRGLCLPHATSPRLVLSLSEESAIGAMVASMGPLAGGKLVCVLPENARKGLNPHQGVVALFSPDDGTPLATFDASAITGLRTAALSAAATDALAPQDTNRLVIFGTGLQAYLHAKMVGAVRPLRQILVHGRNENKAAALCERLKRELGIDCAPITSVSDGLESPSVFCLCTSSPIPYLREEDIPPGSHINAIGACRPGMHEIELRKNTSLRVFVDDLDRVREEASELREAFAGATSPGTLSSVFSGLADGRRGPSDVTLFKTVGTGLLDILAASLALEKLEPMRHGV